MQSVCGMSFRYCQFGASRGFTISCLWEMHLIIRGITTSGQEGTPLLVRRAHHFLSGGLITSRQQGTPLFCLEGSPLDVNLAGEWLMCRNFYTSGSALLVEGNQLRELSFENISKDTQIDSTIVVILFGSITKLVAQVHRGQKLKVLLHIQT